MAFDLNKNDGSEQGLTNKSSASSKFDLSKNETEEAVVPAGSSPAGSSKSKTWIIGLFGVLVVGAGIWYYSSDPKTGSGAGSVSTVVSSADSATVVAGGNQAKEAADVKTVEDPSANQAAAISPDVESGAAASASGKTDASQSAEKAVSAVSGVKDGAAGSPVSGKTAVAGSVVKDRAFANQSAEKAVSTVSGTKDGSAVAAQTGSGVQHVAALNHRIPATFAQGSSLLIKVDQSLVKRLKSYLAKNQGASINVNGYASSDGSLEINQTISQARADAFKKYLVSKNVQESRVVAVGKGIENPIASNQTNAGRKKNRRVEITLP